MLTGLRTALYPTSDLARAKAFYSEFLGFEPYFDEPFYVGYDVGGYELGLVPDGEPGAGGGSALWGVEDVSAAVTRLRALGATVLEDAHEVGGGIVVAAVADPSGNRLGLIYNPHFRVEVGARMAAGSENLSDRAIVVERTVTGTPTDVWAMWTREEELRRWLGNDCRVDARVGGAFEIYFLDEPGKRGSEGCRFLALLAPRMLSFTWNAPPPLKTRRDLTSVVVELEAVEAGTRVRLTHTGWPADGLADPGTDWQATFDYFAAAWPRALDGLTALGGLKVLR